MSEDLRVELEEKEKELILAARAGKNLLKDNQRLEEQLKGLEKVCLKFTYTSYQTLCPVAIC